MLPPRWFGVGSVDAAEPDVGARATNQALVDDGLHNQTLVGLSMS